MSNTTLAPLDSAAPLEPVHRGGRPPKTPRKPVSRLTDTDKAFALKYREDGLTQVEIAQRLNCDQTTISRWLATCTDTTAAAGAYLRGQALPVAEKIVRKGKAADLVKVLQGVSVLAEDAGGRGVTIVVGGNAQVQVNIDGSAPTTSGGQPSLTQSE